MVIQTFIFFDLETTGLIQGKIMPRITEIALIAVTRESICNSNKTSLPRVLHKLIVPINPQKIIPPNVEYMTKLFNDDMLQLQPFECEVYELIMCFLQRLTPPICFVAHNGNRFDYPIFLHELERINKIFDDKILCIDTWKMFQDFFKEKASEPKLVYDLLNDEYNDSLSRLDVNMIEQEAQSDSATISTLQAMSPYKGYIKEIINKKYNTNEEYNDDIAVESPKDFRQIANESTPESQIMRQHKTDLIERPLKKNIPRKRLDFRREKPVSMKLRDIYEYVFGLNFPQEHSAEADCLAMIRCVTNITDFFLEWSQNHAAPLVSCKRI